MTNQTRSRISLRRTARSWHKWMYSRHRSIKWELSNFNIERRVSWWSHLPTEQVWLAIWARCSRFMKNKKSKTMILILMSLKMRVKLLKHPKKRTLQRRNRPRRNLSQVLLLLSFKPQIKRLSTQSKRSSTQSKRSRSSKQVAKCCSPRTINFKLRSRFSRLVWPNLKLLKKNSWKRVNLKKQNLMFLDLAVKS